MNNKIFNFLMENVKQSFILPKYQHIADKIDKDSTLLDLPWTPKKLEKLVDRLENTFDFTTDLTGTLQDVTNDIDKKYSARFWGGIWQPRTEIYQYTGWNVVDTINKANPKAVLDVGCGFNQFKARIPNLVGIDAYNNSADYMVDILDYAVPDNTYDHVIVFGSINFGTFDDIDKRFKKVIALTAPNGTIYVRANPGVAHKNGPWIDIFPWNFDSAFKIAELHNCELVTFKKDNGDRLYFQLRKN